MSCRVFFATLLAALALEASGCHEKGRPDPNIKMAISHEREEVPGSSNPAPTVPSRLEVPAEVLKAYSGIRLAWKDSRSGKEGFLEVPLGGTARIPDSTLDVRADVFLPSFTMGSDVITSTGIEPENPAARIAVLDNGRELHAGWLFTRFPDVHPFQHPRFSLRLEGGVRRASK